MVGERLCHAWELAGLTAIHEIPRILNKPKTYYHFQRLLQFTIDIILIIEYFGISLEQNNTWDFIFLAKTLQWAMAYSFTRFLDHIQRRTTVGRTPLDKWSARRWDLCLTTHNTQIDRHPCPLVGFEPTTSTGERPHTYALDRSAIGTDNTLGSSVIIHCEE